MRFLIKMAIILALTIWFVPMGETKKETNTANTADTFLMLKAAGAAMSDAKGFCERQPETCAWGAAAFTQFGERATLASKALYEYLNQSFGEEGKEKKPASNLRGSIADTTQGLRKSS